ncbi:MAG TPA: hypothetical protein VF771_08680 [Longimicrobiaceae bacterium]
MVHPAAIPGAAIPGIEMIGELPAGLGAPLYSLYSAALAWSAEPDAALPELAPVERDALGRMGEGGCWAAVAVIAGQLAGGERADRGRLAQACFCIADWAISQDARGTALAFTLLAALMVPQNPRYA